MTIIIQPKYLSKAVDAYDRFDEMAEELGYCCPVSMEMYIIPMTDSIAFAENEKIEYSKMVNLTFSKSTIENLCGGSSWFNCPMTREKRRAKDYKFNVTLMDEMTRFATSLIDHPRFGQDAKQFLDDQQNAIDVASLKNALDEVRSEKLGLFNMDEVQNLVKKYTALQMKEDKKYKDLPDAEKKTYEKKCFLQNLVINIPSNHPLHQDYLNKLDSALKGQSHQSELRALQNSVKLKTEMAQQIKSKSEREFKQAEILVEELKGTLAIFREYGVGGDDVSKISLALNNAEQALESKKSHYEHRQKEKLNKFNKEQLKKRLTENKNLVSFNESMLSGITDPVEKRVALAFERIRSAEYVLDTVQNYAKDDQKALNDAEEKLTQANNEINDALHAQSVRHCEEAVAQHLEQFNQAMVQSLGIEDILERNLFQSEAKLRQAEADNLSHLTCELDPPHTPEQIEELIEAVNNAHDDLRSKKSFQIYEAIIKEEYEQRIADINYSQKEPVIKKFQLAAAKQNYLDMLISRIHDQPFHSAPLEQLQIEKSESSAKASSAHKAAIEHFNALDALENERIANIQQPAIQRLEYIKAQSHRANRDYDLGIIDDKRTLDKTLSVYQNEMNDLYEVEKQQLSTYNAIRISISQAENSIKINGNFDLSHNESLLFNHCTRHASNPDFLLRYHVYLKLLYRLHIEQYANLCNVIATNTDQKAHHQFESEKIALLQKIYSMNLHHVELTKIEATIIKDMKAYHQKVRDYIKHILLVGTFLATTMAVAVTAVGTTTMMTLAGTVAAVAYLGYCLYQYLPLNNHQVSCAPYPGFNHENVNHDKSTNFDVKIFYDQAFISKNQLKSGPQPILPMLKVKASDPNLFINFHNLHQKPFDFNQIVPASRNSRLRN